MGPRKLIRHSTQEFLSLTWPVRLLAFTMPVPGSGWNVHDYYEIAFCAKGRGHLKTSHQKYAYRKGSLFFTNQGEAHSVMPAEPSDFYFLQLGKKFFKKSEFDPIKKMPSWLLLKEYLSGGRGGLTSLQLAAPESALVLDSLRFMNKEFLAQNLHFQEILTSEIVKFFWLLLRLSGHEDQEKAPPRASLPPGAEVVDKIQKLFLSHFRDDLSLAQLSQQFNYSTTYLSKIFKAQTGYLLSEYLAEVRLKEACFLLTSGDSPVIDVAGQVGFNNLSYFNRLFKKTFQLTPKEYRQRKMSS